MCEKTPHPATLTRPTAAALAMLEAWYADALGHDQEGWDILLREIEAHRLRFREPDLLEDMGEQNEGGAC